MSQYTFPRLEKHKHHVVRVRDEQLVDEVLVLDARGRAAAAAAALRVVRLGRLRFRVSGVRQRDDDGLLGDQVFHREIAVVLDDLGAALVGVQAREPRRARRG